MSLRSCVPWRAKIGLKLVLARLPVSNGMWRRLRVFRPGSMDEVSYAWRAFRRHSERVSERLPEGFTGLEIGPGDSVASALLAHTAGAGRVVLVDVGAFAVDAPAFYARLAEHLAAEGRSVPQLPARPGLEDVLRACNASYLTNGLASLRTLADASIDFAWSQAVLEHVRRTEFPAFCRELRRVMKPGAVASHRIDLRDHLGGSLHNLRFPARLWEADWFARSGFYTNRIQYTDMLEHFRQAGFRCEVLQVDRWPELPLKRELLADEFRHLPDEELCVSGFDVILHAEG